ncbi:hypothetical protein Rxycam_02173 [Rubrobacter xylanophilus DSM 9941]|uniref:hypothetical protein n=1 Tax=Rubrobacter xylanophilus TaxID=49319 RepID=UPI001C63BFB9|nr:hypothetical protein [Rubrobacter xylanophilus]QYJ16340.1 hypothetical protein Rxycam_02173 [Rubrobacter xylanophilus DSM 9941]
MRHRHTPSRVRSCGTALLVGVALLLCHGVLGSLHLLPSEPLVMQHASGHVHHQEGHCPGGEDYPAVLLTVFLGAAAVCLLWARRERTEDPGRPEAAYRPPRTGAFLPRGPTLPRLQVFLL